MTEQEKNKLIERTSKFDAYQAVWLWGKRAPEQVYGDTLWYAKEKMLNHLDVIRKHEFVYDFALGFIPNDGRYDREAADLELSATDSEGEK